MSRRALFDPCRTVGDATPRNPLIEEAQVVICRWIVGQGTL